MTRKSSLDPCDARYLKKLGQMTGSQSRERLDSQYHHRGITLEQLAQRNPSEFYKASEEALESDMCCTTLGKRLISQDENNRDIFVDAWIKGFNRLSC